MTLRIITFILLLCSSQAFAGLFDGANRSQFVPADQAFAFDFQQKDHQLTLSWHIKPGYYLYRQQIKVVPEKAQLAPLELPPGIWHEDEFFGKTEIFTEALSLPLTIMSAEKGATLSITYQGCAESGFCYPPETRDVPLSQVIAVSNSLPSLTSEPVAEPPPTSTESTLPFSALWAFLIGVGIAFTPCVLPMYPLISGIVLGGKARLSTTRALMLAFIYIQGMALTYTALGLVVAAVGLPFQAALQHPYVLITLSAMFVLLAASMFGLFTLQLPSALQTRLTLISQRQQGGSVYGVFAMGALAGLICSPCTTAPLSAILLYIAQSGDLWLGGGTLYLYALGMGLPLVLVTVFGNKLLPKSGPWMESVKIAFGFVILALPVFLLERVVGDIWGLRLWGMLGAAFFLWAFITSLSVSKPWARVLQIIFLVAAMISVRPLQDWVFSPPSTQNEQAHLNFIHIENVAGLSSALEKAQQAGKPVMLDLYADWCTACKAFEKYTFSDPKIQQALSGMVLLQANVTANNEADQALLRHLNVLGLPTILFFDPQGHEVADLSVTGFMDSEEFSHHLNRLTQ
ncbi:protein-disulfide reductase DsbD [Citrobacter sp. JGM124]|uniref:protein-disulfide reductase DsbD n=1 Tax=Citrobacter sp. JGM124 TaxID=2799789 RepID=UPI001BA848D1|nr:protein-disulfide reductase DsbD [Citrobacter sp. JGM124]MBS0849102.1 protein-disulfide reductase DsbD [Citrobacter sp. JGM124]